MKDLRDLLHLYVGTQCQFKLRSTGRIFKRKLEASDIDPFFEGELYVFVKPILRPLSDITHEEMGHIVEMASIMLIPSYELDKISAAQETKYLLDHGFDLFRLLDDELAIDRTKLES